MQRNINTFILALPIFLLFHACTEKRPPSAEKESSYSYQHPIPFQPEHYICYRTEKALFIDGKMEEAAWQKVPWTEAFVDIEGALKAAPPLRTRAKMLWDSQYFYVAAQLEEPHLWATLTERDAVIFKDDDFEVFIDPDGDGHHYYEFEVNALNTVWDLLLLRPYRVDRRPKVLNNWTIKGLQSAVSLSGTLNQGEDEDQYWSVEIAFPWPALKELAGTPSPPENGDQWRVNFSRVDWHLVWEKGRYRKELDAEGQPLREENWVWSPQGRIAMHHPETWGYVQFSIREAGATPELFVEKEDEKIKWALWQLHFQQVIFKKQNGVYASQLTQLHLPEVQLLNYRFKPDLYSYPDGYRLLAPAMDGKSTWSINEEGRIWLVKAER